MNKMDKFEVINMIGDDLIREAEISPSITAAPASAGEKISAETEGNITVSGVDIYRKTKWQRFAAVASVVLVAGALASGGALMLKNRKAALNDNSNVETDSTMPTVPPVTAFSGNNGFAETDIPDSEDSYPDEETPTVESTSTAHTKVADDVTETAQTMTAAGNSTKKTTANAASPKNSSGIKTIATTTKVAVSFTTTTTTSGPASTVYVPKENEEKPVLGLDTVKLLAKDGADITWAQIEGYECTASGTGSSMVYRYELEDGFVLLASGDKTYKDSPQTLLLCRNGNKNNSIDIRTGYDSVVAFINRKEEPKVQMTLNDVIRLAGYGDMLTWTNFNKYIGEDIGSGIFIYEYKLENGFTLLVGGLPDRDSSPSFIDLCRSGNSSDSIDIRSGADSVRDFINNTEGTVSVKSGQVYEWFNNTPPSSTKETYLSEKISAFPDVTFVFDPTSDHVLYIIENGKTTNIAGGWSAVIWNAYFTDLNGDSYPELCLMQSSGSGFVDDYIIVYDVRNHKSYELRDRMNYNFELYLENGQLFAYQRSINSSWGPFTNQGGISGRLKIIKDDLVFEPIS